MMTWILEHSDEIGKLLGYLVSSALGTWAVLARGRKLLREEIAVIVLEIAASKESVARVDAKLDVVIDIVLQRSPRG